MSPSKTQDVPQVALRGGVEIPQLGFGVVQIPPRDTAEVVTQALLTGYRHIDTASAYGNEAGVGQAVHASGLARDEVFITTKCFNDDHGREQAKRARSASRTSSPAHLERIVGETGVTPAVNQVELHPRFQQAGLRREHAELGIVTEAWSPLAQGEVLDDPEIVRIAQAHGKTPGQVVVRWHLQLANVLFPKSVTPERIEENFDVFDFHLSAAEMEAIEALDAGERIGPDPDTFVRP